MKASLRVFHKSIFETYHQLGFVFRLSLLWLLCALPIVTVGFATIGVMYSIEKKQHEDGVARLFFEGIKKYMKPILQLTALYGIILIPSAFYLWILSSFEEVWSKSISMGLWYLVFILHFMMMYMVSLMVKQELVDVKLIVIRSFRLFVENISFTLNLAIYILLVTVLSLIIPIFLVIWAGLLGFIAYYSLQYLLAKYQPEDYEVDLRVNWRETWKPWRA